jgi:mandelate racemase
MNVASIKVRAVSVPLEVPVKTAAGEVTHAPLVLVDVTTGNGFVGKSYVFTYTPLALKPVCDLATGLAQTLIGRPLAPLDAEAALTGKLRLLGPTGLLAIAVSAIDMACWDALARSVSLPLARLLGGHIRPVKAYLSVGMDGADAAARSARETIQRGFKALKIKIGYPALDEDMAAIESALNILDGKAGLAVDYNQSLDVNEGMRRCRALDHLGLMWIEEPTLQDDYVGHSRIAAEISTPVQIGENWFGAGEMAKAIAQNAMDLAMPDVMKIGGVTGWLRAARLAESAGLPVSAHLFPEVSAHLMCATPTANWLEYLTLADPILADHLLISDGAVMLDEKPGSGVDWNEHAVERYAIG